MKKLFNAKIPKHILAITKGEPEDKTVLLLDWREVLYVNGKPGVTTTQIVFNNGHTLTLNECDTELNNSIMNDFLRYQSRWI